MEATATTLNIVGTKAAVDEPTEVNHNHKPNFGRYVADCPKCAEKFPDGPPTKGPRKKKEAASGVSIEDVMALIAKSGSGGGLSMEQLIAFARELKAPDPEEAAKKAAERERKDMNRKLMVDQARLEEEQKSLRESNCSHTKQNGTSARYGQMHSDGLFHQICVHCFKQFPPTKPRQDQMMMGVG